MDNFTVGKREARQGRRTGLQFGSSKNAFSGSNEALETGDNVSTEVDDFKGTMNSTSPRPTRRQGGWADDFKEKKNRKKKGTNVEEIDERLRPDATVNLEEQDDDIPVIPDLDDVQEDDLVQQVAAPPSVQVTRVATYKELDTDFQKHAGLLTLDGEIDLQLLGSALAPESEVFEEDKVWEWDRIFTEVASELQTEWEKNNLPDENE
ncbi:intraflagellar transport protein 43 homolog isoform X2 [Rhopilema esculentum]|uniref:intraflagellar transport protein 43 homolog isoform X2 n=1 Tax=Rhopilema esculentum TaxID=499914 RepID=UPI0031DE7440